MLTARRATSTELAEALKLQVQRFSKQERAERLEALHGDSQRGDISLKDCFVVTDRRRILGVQLLVQRPDGSIIVWPAEVQRRLSPPSEVKAIKERLYHEARQVVDHGGGWIGQTLLERKDKQQSADLAANGFPVLSELLFLDRPLSEPIIVPSRVPQLSSITFEDSTTHDRFAQVLEESYIGSEDCPELSHSQRTGFSALDGHKVSGQFDPKYWRLFQHSGEDVGVLLLNEDEPDFVWEVLYFGVSSRHRGHGFGRAIVYAALKIAQAAGGQEMILAVDVRNRHALSLYEELGFEEFDRRIAHARIRVRQPEI